MQIKTRIWLLFVFLVGLQIFPMENLNQGKVAQRLRVGCKTARGHQPLRRRDLHSDFGLGIIQHCSPMHDVPVVKKEF